MLLCFIAADLSAQGQRTTRRNLKSLPAVQAESAADTVATAADSTAVTFSGYEKTLRSSKETFFATNNTGRVITDLSVALTYKDMSGRILDRRLVNVAVEIPAGETRRIDINSWDRQKAFYYHLSAVPRSSQVTPYRINVRLLAALAKH